MDYNNNNNNNHGNACGYRMKNIVKNTGKMLYLIVRHSGFKSKIPLD